jgi:hypothetical protein
MFVGLQSLKSRGVKFPLRDPESLAPIFTPPQSVPRATTEGNDLSQRAGEDRLKEAYAGLNITKCDELFRTARNSVDLLSTVLTSSPEQEALQVNHISSFFLVDYSTSFCCM